MGAMKSLYHEKLMAKSKPKRKPPETMEEIRARLIRWGVLHEQGGETNSG